MPDDSFKDIVLPPSHTLLGMFSLAQSLPVEVDTIADFILEKGFVSRIIFHRSLRHHDAICGQLIHEKYSVPYAVDGDEVAHIVVSDDLEDDEARLIAAKELAHISDSFGATAKTEAVVDKMMQDLVIPAEAQTEMASLGIGLEAKADQIGIFTALALLIPYESREEILPYLKSGSITLKQVAELFQIPVAWTMIVMGPNWDAIFLKLCSIYSTTHTT